VFLQITPAKLILFSSDSWDLSIWGSHPIGFLAKKEPVLGVNLKPAFFLKEKMVGAVRFELTTF
jgi:hypothetical protein